MLITDKQELKQYASAYRLWQGIPSIEVTQKGRIFSCFYSGGVMENFGNYVMLVYSDDGVNFTEPVIVTKEDGARCFDPCVWIDPLGRLWLTWGVMPGGGVYGTICEDPDADELKWSEVFFIGHDVMMNKPIVLTSGEWIFPVAVWDHGIRVLSAEHDSKESHRGSFAYCSTDQGKTFQKLGGADVPDRDFDEHMILELRDGTLANYVRTRYGIGVAYSKDKGKTWGPGSDSGLGGPNSRFHIRRLSSGRVLLVNHVDFVKRDHLTALLSEDDGKTWKYKLLLDERDNVSYPDMAEGADGYLYIVYDRERGDKRGCLDAAYACAREILYAKVTEADIMAGKLVSQESKLRCIISKLGKYAKENEDPYGEHMASVGCHCGEA